MQVLFILAYAGAVNVMGGQAGFDDINHALPGFDQLLLVRSGQLMADIASDIAAVPKLAELYGIALSTAIMAMATCA